MIHEVDPLDEILDALWPQGCERVVIRTQAEADEINAQLPPEIAPFSVGDIFYRELERTVH